MQNSYVFVVDHKGMRKTSFVLGIHGNTIEDIIKKAEQEFPNDIVFQGDENMQRQFLSGKAYVNGEFVSTPPTKTEIKLREVNKIKHKYNEKFTAYETALIRAILIGNQPQISKLQTLYMTAKQDMAKELKGV